MRKNHIILPRLGLPVLVATLLATPGFLAAAVSSSDEGRNFDARGSYNLEFEATPTAAQLNAIDDFRAQYPDLLVSFDLQTGATRTLFNAVGYLQPEVRGPALDVGLGFARRNLDLLGLTSADLEEHEVADSVPSKVSSSSHIYLQQLHRQIPVYNGQIQFNIGKNGRLLSLNNGFLPFLSGAVNATDPHLNAVEAVLSAARHLDLEIGKEPEEKSPPTGPRQRTSMSGGDVSLEPLEAALAWLPIRRDEARLVWNFQVHTPDQQHIYDLNVDALDGKVWTRFDWVASDSYQVYPQPVESPIHTTPLPPLDGRVVVSNPADPAAAPFQWHDTNGFPGAEFTVPRGNSVHAFDDLNGDGLPPAVEPNCGAGLNCNFPINLTGDPTTYTSASVANLFYWNNILHDVQYQYGFDEVAGNFQMNNYGAPPAGAGDPVQAHAQDGICINNAFMATPPNGTSPTMFMCLWNLTAPRRDGSLENSIVVHEYGHGISNRLVGGPANVACLANLQQPGEGLSDWWSLAYTALPTHTGATPRGIGTYVLGQLPTGPGIRPLPYSTDNTVNNWTYSSISGMSIPHGVGAVWAQGAWEVYWDLVNQHGFDPNLYNALGGSGNQRMMLYVNEGLKNTTCGPAFTDVRDGIIQAAINNYGGEDVCRVWRSFANYGLGTDAISGGPGSTTPTDGFQVPGSCQLSPQVISAPIAASSVSFAACPVGTKGAGGGCLENSLTTNLFAGEPTAPNFGIEGFLCFHDAAAPNLTAYSVCVNDPGSIGYVQVQQTAAIATGVFVPCPAGKSVIGGGCSDDTFANDLLNTSLPVTTAMFALEGWVCVYNSNTGGSITAHATCIDTPQVAGPGSHGLQVIQQNSTTSASAIASCPVATVTLGGGCWDNTFTSNLRSLLPLTNPPFANEGYACGFSAITGNLTSVALCLAP